jgi:hypothetical protein
LHLVIDGYNLLHSLPELAPARRRGQGVDALAAALRRYRAKKGHRCTLVLDGGPEAGVSRASLSGVPVVYAGAEGQADDVIAEMAGRHGPGLTVVTDDRELAGRCQASGSEVAPAWEFGARLLETALGWEPDGGGDPGWDFTTKKKGPAKRLPKSRRRRARRLNRL